jgi:hypothetical protein
MRVTEWDYRIADVLRGLDTLGTETRLPVTYNPITAQEYLWVLFNDPDTAIFAEYHKDIFTGFAIVSKDKEFQNEYFGFLSKFYVMPKGRRVTPTGRQMMKDVTQWFDENDCVISFATATAAVGEDNMFVNLCKKYGYKHIGTALIRKQYEQI